MKTIFASLLLLGTQVALADTVITSNMKESTITVRSHCTVVEVSVIPSDPSESMFEADCEDYGITYYPSVGGELKPARSYTPMGRVYIRHHSGEFQSKQCNMVALRGNPMEYAFQCFEDDKE